MGFQFLAYFLPDILLMYFLCRSRASVNPEGLWTLMVYSRMMTWDGWVWGNRIIPWYSFPPFFCCKNIRLTYFKCKQFRLKENSFKMYFLFKKLDKQNFLQDTYHCLATFFMSTDQSCISIKFNLFRMKI